MANKRSKFLFLLAGGAVFGWLARSSRKESKRLDFSGSQVNAFFKGNHQSEYAWFSILGANPLASTAAEKAADQIVEALRYGEPHRTITPQARLLVLGNHLFPGLTAVLTNISNRLLPKFNPTKGYIARTGLESQSRWSPSWLTALSDRAAERNNELSRSDLLRK